MKNRHIDAVEGSLYEYYLDHVRRIRSFHISVWFRFFTPAEMWVLAEMAEREGAEGAATLRAIADVRREDEACDGFPMSQAGYAFCLELDELRERLAAVPAGAF